MDSQFLKEQSIDKNVIDQQSNSSQHVNKGD